MEQVTFYRAGDLSDTVQMLHSENQVSMKMFEMFVTVSSALLEIKV